MGIIVDWTKSASPGIEYIDDIDLDYLEGCPDEMETKFWDLKKVNLLKGHTSSV